jgi:hypothetical protein
VVTLKVTDLSIGGRRFNPDKASYPSKPTAFSGVEITWGAESCIEHPEPSRANISLWVPKTHMNYIPQLGDIVSVRGGAVVAGAVTVANTVDMFTGKVESVKLKDDYQPYAGYVAPAQINYVSAVADAASGTAAVAAGWNLYYAGGDLAAYVSIKGNVFTVNKPPNIGTSSFYVYTPRVPVASDKVIRLSHGLPNTRLYIFETRANGTTVKTDVNQFTNDQGYFDLYPQMETTHLSFGFASNWGSDNFQYTVGPFTATQEAANSVVLADPPGYLVNIVASDALAEGGRLRLSDKPWSTADVYSRFWQIKEAARDSGVKFAYNITEDQGVVDTYNVMIAPRDVDSAPALEVYQKTAMAAGLTVISAKNVIQPSVKLKLPTVISANTAAASAVYSWTGSSYVSASILKVNGVQTRRNEARYPVSPTWVSTEWSTVAGTGGVVAAGNVYYDAAFKNTAARAPGTTGGSYSNFAKKWTTAATGGSQGILYKDANITGATGTRLSASMWFLSSTTKNVRLVLTAKNATTGVGTISGPIVSAVAGKWTLIKAEGVTTTNSYTSVEALAEVQTTTNMKVNEVLSAQGLIIEKTATIGKYFDGNTLDAAVNVLISDITVGPTNDPLPLFPASAIVDDVFEIDTTEVINQIKVDYISYENSEYTEKSTNVDQFKGGLAKSTPQQRTLSTEMLTYDNNIGTQFIYHKAERLLAAQSLPQYRLSDGVKAVLSALPEQVSLKYLLDEATRFGHLIKLSGQPNMLRPYFRVKAGRILLGETTEMEFEIEPVEYSAPTPLSKNTLAADDTAYKLRLQNLKTLTANDLRSIGAR